jgi:hypothetical protein
MRGEISPVETGRNCTEFGINKSVKTLQDFSRRALPIRQQQVKRPAQGPRRSTGPVSDGRSKVPDGSDACAKAIRGLEL